MNKALVWVGLLLLPVFSCTVVEPDTPEDIAGEGTNLVVRAVIGNDDHTKTLVQSDGSSIFWTAGDAINLFYGNRSSGQFTTNLTVPSASAEFYGTLGVATGTTESGATAQAFWGVYPYNANNTCDGSGVTLTIPGSQDGVAGTFADKLNPTVATSPGLDLAFYNVCSWFIFSVTQENVVSATFRGLASESLAGTIRVSMDANGRPASEVQSGITEITMCPENGGSFVVGGQYYMVVIPQTLSQGYSLTLTKSDGSTAECVVSGSKAFNRSQYRTKLNADSGLTYVKTGPEAVDLGLPSGLKWASCNVGASAPEEYGDYFAWGETEPYYEAGYAQSESPVWKSGKEILGYGWFSYKFRVSGDANYNVKFNKYCTQSNYWDGTGTMDNKTVLDPEDDAAHVNWGGSWRMPTLSECEELFDNCTWTWTTQNGVNGCKVTSMTNGNSIFLPAAGSRHFTNLEGAGSGGGYWSSSLYWSLYTAPPCNAYGVCLDSDYSDLRDWWSYYREFGFSVRPVYGEFIPVSSVTLAPSSLELEVGESYTLSATISPSNATEKTVHWGSSDRSVATVDAAGLVTAVGAGTATITAYGSSGVNVACTVTVNPSAPDGVEAVDLGLPSGLKWASMNVGATSPEEYGDYFAWGETEPYYEVGAQSNSPVWKSGKESGYSLSSYKWCNDDYNVKFNKYCTQSNYWDGTGPMDNKTVLDLEDDAAHVKWGGSWRMPRDEEWTELRTNCTWTWTTQNGVDGRKVTGPNGKSIFLPAAGCRGNTNLGGVGSYGYYWSSSLYTVDPYYVCGVDFNASWCNGSDDYRYRGRSVRPVSE